MTVPVVWLTKRMLCWDEAGVDQALSGALWRTTLDVTHHVGFDELPAGADGAVVVVPAAYYASPHAVAGLVQSLNLLRWAVVLLTSDEESLFPSETLAALPHVRLWVQTPRERHAGHERVFGYCEPPGAVETLRRIGPGARPSGWFFAGQRTHLRRRQCVGALARMEGGYLVATEGFLSPDGLPQADYLAALANAKVAPCPSGIATPDTFRVWEALAAGCVPVVDGTSPAGGAGYWKMVYADNPPPFPVVDDWATLPAVTATLLADWPKVATRAAAWYLAEKRRFVGRLEADIADASGQPLTARTVDDEITVLVSTSPIPSHPSTAILEETVASVRARLPDAEIILMCDGVRGEQEDRRADYEEYLSRVLDLCRLDPSWANVLPVIHEEHRHQAAMTVEALAMIDTPTILFVEHDTPLVGDIPFAGIVEVVRSGAANVVRFYFEAELHPDHAALTLDDAPRMVEGVPLLRTAQWSQRPMVASTVFYRQMLAAHFGEGSRSMIEDVVYGPCVEAWNVDGEKGWEDWRVWLYAPEGGMKRSTHLDGRAGEPKFEETFHVGVLA